jgi:hypothetical protein
LKQIFTVFEKFLISKLKINNIYAATLSTGIGRGTPFVGIGLAVVVVVVVVTLSAGKSLQSGSFAGMLYKICDFFSVIL